MAVKTIEIMVSGKVQGVFFRQSARDKAAELDVKGQVENLSNGNVKIVATGEEERLDAFYNWCRTGPPQARVSAITRCTLPYREFDSFRVIRG